MWFELDAAARPRPRPRQALENFVIAGKLQRTSALPSGQLKVKRGDESIGIEAGPYVRCREVRTGFPGPNFTIFSRVSGRHMPANSSSALMTAVQKREARDHLRLPRARRLRDCRNLRDARRRHS